MSQTVLIFWTQNGFTEDNNLFKITADICLQHVMSLSSLVKQSRVIVC